MNAVEAQRYGLVDEVLGELDDIVFLDRSQNPEVLTMGNQIKIQTQKQTQIQK